LAVADAFQAMTDTRPYRKALSFEAAMEELRRNAGTQFDPQVVDAFMRTRGAAPRVAPPTPSEPLKADNAVSPA
jgi:HD-GYP domain-containing protein (c-di-GMP phosphodiesterase class II)